MRRHAGQIRFGLVDAVRVCVLIVRRDGPETLEKAAVRWIQRFAAEAHGQRLVDYEVIIDAFDAMVLDREVAAEELRALSSSRGCTRTDDL